MREIARMVPQTPILRPLSCILFGEVVEEYVTARYFFVRPVCLFGVALWCLGKDEKWS